MSGITITDLMPHRPAVHTKLLPVAGCEAAERRYNWQAGVTLFTRLFCPQIWLQNVSQVCLAYWILEVMKELIF